MAEFGDKIVTSYADSVPESADAERVFRDMVGQGNKMIFGTSFGFMEFMLRTSKKFPNVNFQHCGGYKTAPNMSTYEGAYYEGAYLAGVIAGKMSKTGILGAVGSVPIPQVIRNINAYTLGAQSVNQRSRPKWWVNEWFNPPKESETAIALINGGAVSCSRADSPAVLKATQEKGVRAFGWDST